MKTIGIFIANIKELTGYLLAHVLICLVPAFFIEGKAKIVGYATTAYKIKKLLA